MKWSVSIAKTNFGDTKEVRPFLWFPKRCYSSKGNKMKMVWLECVSTTQTFTKAILNYWKDGKYYYE